MKDISPKSVLLLSIWPRSSLLKRLFRHGQHFDFMHSWKSNIADKNHLKKLIGILNDEIQQAGLLTKFFLTHGHKADRSS